MPQRVAKGRVTGQDQPPPQTGPAGFTLAAKPAADAGESAVRAAELRLAYGDRQALQAYSLDIPAQRITAVIGPNGSGKSSLLDAIAGLLPPRAGRIEAFGHRPCAGRGQVAYALQQTRTDAVIPLTVREVVRMGRYPHRGLFRPLTATDHAAVDDALERLAIGHLARRQLSELSGGERQRVFVAQVLAQRARLILLDEPATALDLPTQRRIAEVLLAERERGNTIVYTTHSVTVAAEADWVVLLAGRVVAAGQPNEVLSVPRLAEAYGNGLTMEGATVAAHSTQPRH